MENLALTDGEALSEREDKLLRGGEEEEAETPESIAAMLSVMNETINNRMDTVLKRLSAIEQDKELPSKKRRVESVIHSDSCPSEGDHSDSEDLVKGKARQPEGEAPKQVGEKQTASEAGECLLQEIAQDFDAEATTSPSVSQKLADIVNNRWENLLNESKLKEKMEQYSRPENCDKLMAPRVNPEIWGKLNHTSHGSDLKMVNLQKTLVRVGSALTQSIEILLSKLAEGSNSDFSPTLTKLVKYDTDKNISHHQNKQLYCL